MHVCTHMSKRTVSDFSHVYIYVYMYIYMYIYMFTGVGTR